MRLLIVLIALSPVGVVAQESDDPAELFAAETLRCDLRRGTQASWDEGALKLEDSLFGQGGRFTLDSIDTSARTARLIGSLGAVDVWASATQAGVTFIGQTASGNVNITTVFAYHESATSRAYVTVQSRHQNMVGPFPSQYHGTCRVLP